MKIEVIQEGQGEVPAYLMNVGDVGVVTEATESQFVDFVGHFILRSFSGLVSLSRPRSTWGEPSNSWPGFKVKILPPGTKISLTIQEE